MKLRNRGYLEESVVVRSFLQYLVDAQYRFLQECAKMINDETKSHGKAIATKQGSVVWLKYDGTDSSDIDFSFYCHVVEQEKFGVTLFVESDKPKLGTIEKKYNYNLGTLTTKEVFTIFMSYFG